MISNCGCSISVEGICTGKFARLQAEKPTRLFLFISVWPKEVKVPLPKDSAANLHGDIFLLHLLEDPTQDNIGPGVASCSKERRSPYVAVVTLQAFLVSFNSCLGILSDRILYQMR